MVLVFAAGGAFCQNDEFTQRGSIPEELLRPRLNESPRYPIDTVIGPLGKGQASAEAYECARNACAALLAGSMDAPIFSTVNKVFLEGCTTALNVVNPRFFRLGSGREEPDGSVSFLVRFAGREQGIVGELFVRLSDEKVWGFEDLVLEAPRNREEEAIEGRQKYDFSPYERFF